MLELPWDVVVPGTPASVQGSSARRRQWKAAVTAAARTAWPAGIPPLAEPLSLRVTCFHLGAPLDVDNMLKPIQDALVGVVYDDDKHLTDVQGSLRDLNGAYIVRGITPQLAKGFTQGIPFVHIKLDSPPDHKELP
ncbi:RusA family crossover junction endodeoxyribonuclease [Actinomadura geliboluensis]|jgi:hypothetical protein|uniref:RusA family crossover junction endodeoxyribonuclease n=1 Tax=Actinomadura geliboluensis TaxID=882440 RepID=UPI003711BFB3